MCQAGVFQHLTGSYEICGVETKFGVLPAARRPFAGAFAMQASTNTDVRLDSYLLGCTNDLLQLFQFFRNDDDQFAKLATKERDANESGIFIAVADNQTLRVFLHGKRSHQLRLAACFEPEMKLLPCVHDFLDDLTQLVDFDGKNASILTAISKLGARALERAIN